MKPYRIFRHPEIEQDLLDIIELVANYAGSKVAINKLLEIEQSILKLSEFPFIGSLRNDIYPGVRAIPSAKKGVITFTVDEAEHAIYVISITYAGADWISRLSSRTDL